MKRDGDHIGKGCSVVLICVILLNAVVSILLIAGLVYCMTQITHYRQEIVNYKQLSHESKQQNSKTVNGNVLHGKSNDEGIQFGVNTSKNKEPGENRQDEVSGLPISQLTKCCGTRNKHRKHGGHKGDKGEEGSPGMNGKNGDKGDTGPPGPSLYYESAHFVGDGGGKRSFNNKNIVTSWTEDHISDHMSYAHGQLTVSVGGYYYIYSQLYYFDTTRSMPMGHLMYIDDRKVLKAIRKFSNISDSQQTMYIGGTFKIKKGQKLYIKVANERLNHFDAASSFFGAFMIRHDSNWNTL